MTWVCGYVGVCVCVCGHKTVCMLTKLLASWLIAPTVNKKYNQLFVHYISLFYSGPKKKKDMKTKSHPCLFVFLINTAKCINGTFLAASNKTPS